MKELLQQLAAYNFWANQKIISSIETVPEELTNHEIVSSFPSIHKTLMHMWDAESIWWQRMKLQEMIFPPSEKFKGSTLDVGTSLLHQDSLWKAWVDNASLAALDHVFQYQNTKREQFKQPIFQMLLHLFNHNTYHRGQLITMLRQVGVQKLPATDFIVWSRSKR